MFIQVTLEHFPAEVKSDGTVVVDNTEWFVNYPPPPLKKQWTNLKISGVLETNRNLAEFRNKKLFLAAERGIISENRLTLRF